MMTRSETRELYGDELRYADACCDRWEEESDCDHCGMAFGLCRCETCENCGEIAVDRATNTCNECGELAEPDEDQGVMEETDAPGAEAA
jgi:hypothetical protein